MEFEKMVYEYTKEHGGGTFSRRSGKPIENLPLFVVGIFPEKTIAIPLSGFTPERVAEIIRYNFRLDFPGIALGTWINKGHVIIDTVALIHDKNAAICLGKLFNQISIWDVATGKEIETGGDGKPIRELKLIGETAREAMIERLNNIWWKHKHHKD